MNFYDPGQLDVDTRPMKSIGNSCPFSYSILGFLGRVEALFFAEFGSLHELHIACYENISTLFRTRLISFLYKIIKHFYFTSISYFFDFKSTHFPTQVQSNFWKDNFFQCFFYFILNLSCVSFLCNRIALCNSTLHFDTQTAFTFES